MPAVLVVINKYWSTGIQESSGDKGRPRGGLVRGQPLGNCSLHRLSAYSWCPIHPRPCGDASNLVQVLHYFADAFICGALGRLQAASYWCCIFLLTLLFLVHWVACKQPRTGAAFFCWRFYFWFIGSPASSLVLVFCIVCQKVY